MSFDHQRGSGPPPSMHKPLGTIDVINSSVRDTRRPPLEFREAEQKPDMYVAVVLSFMSFMSYRSIHECCRIDVFMCQQNGSEKPSTRFTSPGRR